MRVSLNWLTDYVDISMPAVELGKLLTDTGLNLEEIVETETDIVLDIEVTSNRPDCLGHLGVAREIAAVTGAEFRPPKIADLPTSGKVEDLTSVDVLDPDLCPRYTARVIRGVKIGPSPRWMVERLEAVGMRGINNVVDVTNYVLMEYSQPLHSFDYDKLAENRIVVRRARQGEVMVSIDGTTCRLDENMLIIADAEKVVAIAGVMGGLDTEVSESTTKLLIESAQFDPLVTRYTSRKLQLMSESNYRFERGVDPVRLDEASLRACQLIIELGGGELAGGAVDVWANPWEPRTVELRPQRCDALLGMSVPADRQAEILTGLGLDPKKRDGKIVCTIPPHRSDLEREVDLIEEVGRIEGFDRIPVAAAVTHPVEAESTGRRTMRAVRETMSACGFDEAISSTFVDACEAELFGFSQLLQVDARVRRTNNWLRPTIFPSLLRACKTNQDAGNSEVSLYEAASVFWASEGQEGTAEHVEVAIVTTRDLRDLTGALEAVVLRIDPNAEVIARGCEVAGFAPFSSGEVLMDGEPVGSLGVLAPDVLDYYGLNTDRPIAAAAVRFDTLQQRADKPRHYAPLAKFPPVRRELSLVVDEALTWLDLAEAIAQVGQPMRESVSYVTTYRGRQVPTGRKSVSVQITYRSSEGTLTSEQIDEQVDQVLDKLARKFSAKLRS